MWRKNANRHAVFDSHFHKNNLALNRQIAAWTEQRKFVINILVLWHAVLNIDVIISQWGKVGKVRDSEGRSGVVKEQAFSIPVWIWVQGIQNSLLQEKNKNSVPSKVFCIAAHVVNDVFNMENQALK